MLQINTISSSDHNGLVLDILNEIFKQYKYNNIMKLTNRTLRMNKAHILDK